MKITIKHIVAAAFLQSGVLLAQNNQPELKTFSVGARAVHLYDLPSERYDSEMSKDMKGLSGANTSFDLGFDIYAEKQFTPLWGLQLGFRKGGLTGSNEVEYFRNDFSTGYADLLFNLSNLDKRHPDSRINYYLKGGMGYGAFSAERFLISDDSPNGNIDDNYWEGRLGAGVQYELNSFLRLELDVAYNIAFNDGFDGYNYATGSDPYLSTGLGLAYTFGKTEHKPMYAVSFFGEEYFGTAEPTRDTKADSLMAADIAAAKTQMENMDRVIAEQKAAIARLEQEKAVQKEVKVQERELVFFAFDSSALSEDAKRELAKALKGGEDNIILTGYADNTGNSEYNQKLKQRRAEAVKQFLVEALGYESSAISIHLAEEINDLKNNDFLNRKVVVEYHR